MINKTLMSRLAICTGLHIHVLERMQLEEVTGTIVQIKDHGAYVNYNVLKGRVVEYVGDPNKVKSLLLICGDISPLHMYSMTAVQIINKNKILDNTEDVQIQCTVEFQDYTTVVNIYAGEIKLDFLNVKNNKISFDDTDRLHAEIEGVELILMFDKAITDEELEILKGYCYSD